MSATLDEIRLLPAKEAAAVLSVSVRSLDHLVAKGVLQPVRLVPNGHRRFKVADLARLVATPTTEDEN